MFVWNAMLSITPMISAICLLDFVMPSIVAITSPTTLPPVSAAMLADAATWVAWRAVSELLRTVVLISSIDAAVCCRLLAWLSVRDDRSSVPAAISDVARCISDRPSRTSSTVARMFTFICVSARIRPPISSLRLLLICCPRSPAAIRLAKRIARRSGSTMEVAR